MFSSSSTIYIVTNPFTQFEGMKKTKGIIDASPDPIGTLCCRLDFSVDHLPSMPLKNRRCKMHKLAADICKEGPLLHYLAYTVHLDINFYGLFYRETGMILTALRVWVQMDTNF